MSNENPKFEQYFDIIDQEIFKADRIICDMREMASAGNPCLEPISLSCVVREVLDWKQADANLRFELVTDPDPYMIVADHIQCRQLTAHLITNAIHAVDGNGKICVELRQEEEHAVVTVRDDEPGVDN